MTAISTSEAFQKRHPGLAARLAGIASSLFPAQPILLRDADETSPAAGRSLTVRRMVKGDEGTHNSEISTHDFCYDDPQSELALAGLLAHIARATGNGPIAADPQSLSVFALSERLARSDVPVLITGPTGTGKEVLSRFIHDHSSRKGASFVAINCAAIPEAMLEALLFGHQKGAFTGASSGGTGFFREADGGTLLLDEIAEMPVTLQAKLLRALQEGEVIPVGATKPIKVDVRIIACANRNLPTEVREGRFREDLFYRLNVFPLDLLALRERPADIAPLACGMLLRHAGAGAKPITLSQSAMAMLRAHSWPGNVRELENVIRRALVLSSDTNKTREGRIGPEHISFDVAVRLEKAVNQENAPTINPAESSPGMGSNETSASQKCSDTNSGNGRKLSKIVQISEARAILDTLKACGGKRIDAARELGISERTLRYRLASFRDAGIDMEAVR